MKKKVVGLRIVRIVVVMLNPRLTGVRSRAVKTAERFLTLPAKL